MTTLELIGLTLLVAVVAVFSAVLGAVAVIAWLADRNERDKTTEGR